jgi:hypothetical protein
VDALLLLLEPVEAIVVPVGLVEVGSEAVVISVPVGVTSDKAAVVTEPGIVAVADEESAIGADDADNGKVPEPGVEIRVMAKEGLVSPESPNKTMR